MTSSPANTANREQVVFLLYEAAELEHNLMCTYLYAAFSLKRGAAEGLTPAEGEAVDRWRRAIVDIAIEEMGHLAAVWNITSALGAAPRIGRMNFPIDPGYMPAGVVAKLAPFNAQTLQHFIHLERPHGSTEPDGDGFALGINYGRGSVGARLTPMPLNYDTVGDFYTLLSSSLRGLVGALGEDVTFCGNPALQLSPAEIDLNGARRVICIKTALQALDAIVAQGEGAPGHSVGSHYQKFAAIREEHARLLAGNPEFKPAHPAATNPVLRRPPKPEGRVWLEHDAAVETVDLANASYGLMLRLLAHAYITPTGAEKTLAVDIAMGLMRALAPLGERAARLPAGPSNAGCNAGVSFATLRDAAAFPPGPAAWRYFNERLAAFAAAGAKLAEDGDARAGAAARILSDLVARAAQGAKLAASAPQPHPAAPQPSEVSAPATSVRDGVEIVAGQALTLMFEARRCIHARFCVTGAPGVFLANVKGPWIHPDAMDAERLVDIAHACPSGAIQYARKDGRPDEAPPLVNLVTIRESGPYAFRGDLGLAGEPAGRRATLCRCGASKNKPFCDGSHHDVGFAATGEPPSGATDMLAVRDGSLEVDPQTDGPLQVRGNVEIVSGTGRVVARRTSVRLCRCGASANKPFCDGSHARVGFRST